MRIQRIDDALERCGKYLTDTDSINDEIKNLLAQSLLILICSEFEKAFRNMVRKRCSSVSDKVVNESIESYTKRVPRSSNLDEVSGLLKRFGSDHKAEFKRQLARNSQVESMYSSIVNDRNDVAHGKGSNATFREVKQYYEEAHVVLDYFRDALFRNVDDAA